MKLHFSKYLWVPTLWLLVSCTHNSQQKPSSISIHTDFEGGKVGDVKQQSATQWELALEGEDDWENRNRQVSWYYFRIEGAKDQSLTLDLTDLVGEYNYKPGSHAITSETRPVISYDQKHWQHLTDEEVEWNEEKVELRLKLTPEKDTMWVAHQAPYTTQDLNQLLSAYQEHPSITSSSIGETADGRPIPLVTVTNPDVSLSQKKVIWLMARQHSWESGTSWVMEGVVRHLLDTKEGEGLLDSLVFQLIPMADPDGVARGGVRFNKFGHDLNRNWDLVKPEEMPEIAAEKKAVADWLAQGNPINFFLTLHNTERSDYVQGPDLPVGQKLWDEMVAHTSFESEEGVRPMPATTTEGKPGRMTVNQALWAEYQIPAYLMELKVEKVEKLDARRTVQDWLHLGSSLVQATAAAVR